MARNERDNSNDIAGGRDSIIVHPLSHAEKQAAAELIQKLGERWRRRTARSYKRRDVAIEEVLLSLDLMKEADASKAWREYDRRHTLATGSNKNWFGRSDESGR